MSKETVGRTTDVITDLAAALERLKAGKPLIVSAPYRINQSTVCKEAGRVRSTIKNQDVFAGLKRDIAAAAEKHSRKGRNQQELQSAIKRQAERLKQENDDLERLLDDAARTIYQLHCQLQSLENDRKYILDRVADARRVSATVDKQFRIMNFDRLVDLR